MRVLVLLLLATLAVAVPATAQRRGGGHRGYSHSYGGHSNSHSPGRSYSYHAPRSPSYHAPRSYRAPRSYSYHAPRSSTHAKTYHAPRTPRAKSYAAGGRDGRGRIKRSESAKSDFMRSTGYPHGRNGYVVDHIVPLACGGADAPSNMQWQSATDAKAKDRWERKGCRR